MSMSDAHTSLEGQQSDSDHIKASTTIPTTLPSSSSDDDTLIILDWDDTLMPSTYILSVIEYTKNPITGTIKTVKVKKEHRKDFKNKLEKVGVAAYDLLTKLLCHFEASQIKIVTNGDYRWLKNSLKIAGTFVEQYNKIKKLLVAKQIECVYARDSKYHPIQWKIDAYDSLLCQMSLQKTKMNILTVGDQTTDHQSIEQTESFRSYHANVYHHQVKLHKNADSQYMSKELMFINNHLLSILDAMKNILKKERTERIFIKFEG